MWQETVTQAAALAHTAMAQRTPRKGAGKKPAGSAAHTAHTAQQQGQGQEQPGSTLQGEQPQQLQQQQAEGDAGSLAGDVQGIGVAVGEGQLVVGEGRLVDGLVRAFHGVSPSLVCDLCDAAGEWGGAQKQVLWVQPSVHTPAWNLGILRLAPQVSLIQRRIR